MILCVRDILINITLRELAVSHYSGGLGFIKTDLLLLQYNQCPKHVCLDILWTVGSAQSNIHIMSEPLLQIFMVSC